MFWKIVGNTGKLWAWVISFLLIAQNNCSNWKNIYRVLEKILKAIYVSH